MPHSRGNTMDFLVSLGIGESELTGPTSTTKAMLINILCPRRVMHKTEEADDTEEEEMEGKDQNDSDKAKPITVAQEEKSESQLEDNFVDNTPRLGNSRKTPGKEASSGQAFSSTSTSLTAVAEIPSADEAAAGAESADQTAIGKTENAKDEKSEQSSPEEAPPMKGTEAVQHSDDGTTAGSEISLPQRQQLQREDRETSEISVTPDLAAAVTPMVMLKVNSPDDPQREEDGVQDEEKQTSSIVAMAINMEELLRVTFDNLLKEWHLLNVPMCSYVDAQQKPIDVEDDSDESTDDTTSEKTDNVQSTDGGSWIYLQVLARPTSLGIILERLEHIGVGIECGTLSIFKVELCKTASPYAHMKQKEEEEQKRQLKELESMESRGDKSEEEKSGKDENGNTSSKSLKQSLIPALVDPVGADDNTKPKVEESNAPQDGADNKDKSNPKPKERGLDDSNAGSEASSVSKKLKEAREEQDRKVKEARQEQERVAAERKIEAARAEWKSAATRLRIQQLREQIVEQADISFDFVSLVSIASILAGVGLITNNTVVIVASMLVSPIMGPVLGLTFGSRIQDWPLVRTSLWHETLALMGCVLIGALLGVSSCWSPIARDTWPTNEMESRGETTGLLTGIAIAIPSGMGVCLGIIGGNTGSLVGVAISASLLPPAVNAGICFAYAIFLHADLVETPDSMKDASDFATIGAISFALTALNIVCIWLAGIVMFKIKEVAPFKEKSAFWARDLKIARDLNNIHSSSAKPPPVNLSKISAGIKTALVRRKSAEGNNINQIESVIVVPPPAPFTRQQTPLPSSTTFGYRSPFVDTWALTPKHKVRKLPHEKDAPDSSEDVVSLFAELPFQDDPDHGKDDRIEYVGLEDMAALLGFDKEDDDGEEEWRLIDHAAIARNLGRGRYI